MLVVRPTNRVANSPYYGRILKEYNERFAQKGKVNETKFFNEVVKDLIPNYSYVAWCEFARKFKTTAGLVAANAALIQRKSEANVSEQKETLAGNALTMAQAQNFALRKAIDIGLTRLKEIGENPSLLPFDKAIDLIFKSMKAQDSRARVIKEIREDEREQEKFDKLLNESSYNG